MNWLPTTLKRAIQRRLQRTSEERFDSMRIRPTDGYTSPYHIARFK